MAGYVPSSSGSGPAGGDFYQSSFSAPPPPPISIGSGAPPPPPLQDANNPNPSNPLYYLPPMSVNTTSFDDEPPLLEELGINLPSCIAKARAVLNPFTKYEASFFDEADMTGPIALCLLLGFLLLLQRKVQFGVIYGQATVGCIAVYVVFNLMSPTGIDMYRSTSILGYSLLPMVILSFLAVFLPIKRVKLLGVLVGGGCIGWSTSTATKIFVATLEAQDQSFLIAYPLLLLYVSFALVTVY
jgi:protein YIPF5/7